MHQSILLSISQMAFSRSHHNSKLQKLFTLHFKAAGTSARALDTLSALGVTMSQSWSYDGIDTIAIHTQDAMRDANTRFAYALGHDNLNIPFNVQQQRNDPKHQKHFDNGTVGVNFVHTSPFAVMPKFEDCKQKLIEGAQTPITPEEIFELDMEAEPRFRVQYVW